MAERQTWIEFADDGRSKSGKTGMWLVVSKSTGAVLGRITWFGRWRCYSFWPIPETTFNAGCMRDIAEFCEAQTRKQKAAHGAGEQA